MRSAILAGAIFAAGSLALPVLEQRDIVIETAVETFTKVVWVKVTGPSPTATPTPTPSVVQNIVKPAAVTPAPVNTPAPVTSAAPATSAAPVVQAPAPVLAPAPASSPETAPASSGASGSFEQMVVDAHNKLRAAHQVGNLQYDDDLAASALALAQTCKFHHDVSLGPASSYGQNIAASFGTLGMHDAQTEMESVISDAWYTNEAAQFAQLGLYGVANPLNNDFDAWGHFTQEVWKDTTHVGCAAYACTQSDFNGYFTVCNYSPPGNYANDFAQNVFN